MLDPATLNKLCKNRQDGCMESDSAQLFGSPPHILSWCREFPDHSGFLTKRHTFSIVLISL